MQISVSMYIHYIHNHKQMVSEKSVVFNIVSNGRLFEILSLQRPLIIYPINAR